MIDRPDKGASARRASPAAAAAAATWPPDEPTGQTTLALFVRRSLLTRGISPGRDVVAFTSLSSCRGSLRVLSGMFPSSQRRRVAVFCCCTELGRLRCVDVVLCLAGSLHSGFLPAFSRLVCVSLSDAEFVFPASASVLAGRPVSPHSYVGVGAPIPVSPPFFLVQRTRDVGWSVFSPCRLGSRAAIPSGTGMSVVTLLPCAVATLSSLAVWLGRDDLVCLGLV